MANFEPAYARTMGNEGGIANHPADKGGLTYKGITFRDWPNWSGWAAVNRVRSQTGDTGQINKLLANDTYLQADVRKFYKLYYWDVNKLDQVDSQALANELFDTGVNMGTKTAALFLQKSLNALNRAERDYKNIDVDGIVGPTTLHYTNSHPNPTALLKVINGYQFKRYIELVEREESQEVFLPAWITRVDIG